ncbi:MAG TPA: Asp-tRNA(Asn)/Glu-tRNA(Gln) amidotransferase subunit GatC [Chloroflexota bacterium]|nr:Asp-tRNA(Asn)/Glu-tRNA(Gln) amidotransferase subunit GatC [Chloroflexota bacterium]
MAVSREVVEHVAALVHLGLDPSETEELARDLSSVLEHVAILQQVDTRDVSPTGHALEMRDVMRDDVVVPSWSPQEVLANAPRRNGDFFEVQGILD